MKDLAELVTAVVSLLWFVFLVGAIVWFRKPLATILTEVGRLVPRLKRGKFLGQEVELERGLVELRESATVVEAEALALPSPPPPLSPSRNQPLETSPIRPSPQAAQDAAEFQRLVFLGHHSPKIALVVLASKIEQEVQTIMATSGWGPAQQIRGLAQSLDFLQRSGILPAHLAGSIKQFYDVRNRVVHTGTATEDDALRALDSGIVLLRALQAIPREINVVEHPHVAIFKDEALTVPHKGHAVILRTTSPGGTADTFRIFPTLRNHFAKAKRVAWEWDQQHQWDKAWYRDPVDGQVKAAWHSSMEFVGRHLDDDDA